MRWLVCCRPLVVYNSSDRLPGTSIGFDLIIIVLPLPVLWRLQLRTRQKVLLKTRLPLANHTHETGRPDLPIRPRLLRNDHPNRPNLQRQKPQNLHRQQKPHPLVHRRGQPRCKIFPPPNYTNHNPNMREKQDNRRLHPSLRPVIQSLRLNNNVLPHRRNRTLLPAQRHQPQHQHRQLALTTPLPRYWE